MNHAERYQMVEKMSTTLPQCFTEITNDGNKGTFVETMTPLTKYMCMLQWLRQTSGYQ